MIKNFYDKLLLLITDKQFIKYTIIGLSGVSIDFVLYSALITFTPINFLIANFLSISIAIINNFVLNAFLNFRKKDKLLLRFLSFYIIGFLGILISQILLLVFVKFGIGEVLAKFLTLPFILILQFILNRKFSFNENSINYKKQLSSLKKHRYILIVMIIFTFMSLVLVKTIPSSFPQGGPDESTHYKYNVEYIIKNKKLPESGKDDISAYKNCKDRLDTYVTCTYSYQSYIGANYAVYAGFGYVTHEITNISLLKSTRILSVIFGLLYILFIYLTILKITKRPNISALITSVVSLIPQVIFVFSYINQDAHSLAIAAFIIFCLVSLWKNPGNNYYQILCGVAIGGLLPLSKYNYLLILPLTLIFFFYALLKNIINSKQLFRLVIYILLSFLLFSSFWYIRNYILYSDFLGQNFVISEMSKYHELGIQYPLMSLSTLGEFTGREFFDYLFKSFFFSFGYMRYYLNESVYYIIGFALVGVLVLFVKNAYEGPRQYWNKSLFVIFSFLIYLLATIFLVYYNSIRYDFQPQGRYIFSVLPLFAASVSVLYSMNKNNRYAVALLLVILLFLIVNSINIFIGIYL